MMKMPAAMTMSAPRRRWPDGEVNHTSRSIAKAHSSAVYSKGPTTEGGAWLKADVSHS